MLEFLIVVVVLPYTPALLIQFGLDRLNVHGGSPPFRLSQYIRRAGSEMTPRSQQRRSATGKSHLGQSMAGERMTASHPERPLAYVPVPQPVGGPRDARRSISSVA